MTTVEDTGRRERKRLQMVAHLVAVAGRLFETQAYGSVTMEQIALEADVAKRTLYNHFPTKEALLAHWLEAELKRDLERLAPELQRRRGFVARVSAELDASADWCGRHPAHLAAYLRHRFLSLGEPPPPTPARADPDRGDIALLWRTLIAEAQAAGEVTDRFSTAQLASWFHHLYLGTLMRWLMQPKLVLREEFAQMVALFMEGAGERGGAALERSPGGAC
ncbi:TetR/AcrR family transcriptional regulator [Trinickia dabaoshanensis]|uniref:TetR/AcrR family transcriptional regulator n=1 Tax=Trinickia dabaoshanensis TaxID=564714 RepID=A0A2N7VUN8_9BURK|nr:TetR/AcrR family transcriptional regulator [Trinickia dabaoshanensis]PMS20875.1 TetR/AcrR family transcriptional regulator [Trinickia dabaoshanensis]